MHTSHTKFRSVLSPCGFFFLIFFLSVFPSSHLFVWISTHSSRPSAPLHTHTYMHTIISPLLTFQSILNSRSDLILCGLCEFAFGFRPSRHNKYLSLDCFACVRQQSGGACVLLNCFGIARVCWCVCLCVPGQHCLCPMGLCATVCRET